MKFIIETSGDDKREDIAGVFAALAQAYGAAPLAAGISTIEPAPAAPRARAPRQTAAERTMAAAVEAGLVPGAAVTMPAPEPSAPTPPLTATAATTEPAPTLQDTAAFLGESPKADTPAAAVPTRTPEELLAFVKAKSIEKGILWVRDNIMTPYKTSKLADLSAAQLAEIAVKIDAADKGAAS